jgi:vancomycin permeability regulator SanA
VFTKVFKIILKIIKLSIGFGLVVILLPRTTALFSFTQLYSVENAPAMPVAIVFGAGLWRDCTPTTVLRDRIETAAALFFSGKVEKILMSGDNRFLYYNEPGAMRDYALSLDVPESAIVLDYAGRRTYDTC